jgi:hypothetical protein
LRDSYEANKSSLKSPKTLVNCTATPKMEKSTKIS